MVSVEEFCRARKSQGPATILAIGTATPPNVYEQSTFPDYLFRVTKSEHMTQLKSKFKRMCTYSLKHTYIDALLNNFFFCGALVIYHHIRIWAASPFCAWHLLTP